MQSSSAEPGSADNLEQLKSLFLANLLKQQHRYPECNVSSFVDKCLGSPDKDSKPRKNRTTSASKKQKKKKESTKPKMRVSPSENWNSGSSESNRSDCDDNDKEWTPDTEGASNEEKPVGVKDDNYASSYKERIAKEEDNSDFTVTRQVKSANFEDSQKPWRLATEIWERLYPFQKEGVQFFQKRTDCRSGGILADEMGLGKTIQAIAYLRSVAETGRNNYKSTGLDTALVVCNVSLIYQWIEAFNEWFPKVRVFLVHSKCTTVHKPNWSQRLFASLENKEKFPHGAVVLTTYETFTKLQSQFVKHHWQVVILDEGHHIRNENTKCSQAMRELKTTQRFILTGTPYQNNLQEFWKLIDFVHPGKLSDSGTFYNKFIKIIDAGSNLNCSPIAAAKAYECLCALRTAVTSLILRRCQKDHKVILKLPEKQEIVLNCELSDRQRRVYNEYLSSNEVASILEKRLKALSGISKLSHICNHPGIYRGVSPENEKFGPIEDSGKVAMVFELFKEWFKTSENRVVFFTQRLTVIKMMQYYLDLKRIRHLSFSGAYNSTSRKNCIEEFNRDKGIKVLMATTRVGGLGLNLTGANKAIIFDPDWNPQADNQAQNRIYRVGQAHDVTIVRLISNGTIEDKKYLKQAMKELRAAQVLENSDETPTIPRNTLMDLFTLAPKGLQGSELGLYMPGEIAPEAPADAVMSKEEKKDAKKRMKKKLKGFEDRNLLLSLFDEQKLVAMKAHSDSLQKNIMTQRERRDYNETVGNAVHSLIHTNSRLAHTWKYEFHKMLKGPSEESVVCDYFVEEEEQVDEYWKNNHRDFRVKDDRTELGKLLSFAKKLIVYLNGVSGAKDTTILKIFSKDINQKDSIQMSFIREIISTLAKFDKKTEMFRIRSKYRDVEVVDKKISVKRPSNEFSSYTIAKKSKVDGSSNSPSTSSAPSTSTLE